MPEKTDNNRYKNRLDFELYKLGIESRVASHYPTQEFKQVKYDFKLPFLYIGYAFYGMLFRPKPEEYLKHLLKNPFTLNDLVQNDRTGNIPEDISKSIDLQNNDNTIIKDVIAELETHNSKDPRIELLEYAKTTPDPTNLNLSALTHVVSLNLEEEIKAIIQNLEAHIQRIESNDAAPPDLDAFCHDLGASMPLPSKNEESSIPVVGQDQNPTAADDDPIDTTVLSELSEMEENLEKHKTSLQQTQKSQTSSLMAPTEDVESLRQMLAELQERKNALELESQKNNDSTKQQELENDLVELNQEIADLEQQIATPSPNQDQP